jgi:hypothetical protein
MNSDSAGSTLPGLKTSKFKIILSHEASHHGYDPCLFQEALYGSAGCRSGKKFLRQFSSNPETPSPRGREKSEFPEGNNLVIAYRFFLTRGE